MKLFSLKDYKQTKAPFGYSIAKWSWSQSFIRSVWASSLSEITPLLSPPLLYHTQANGHHFQSFITNLHTSETAQMTRLCWRFPGLCLVSYQLSSWLLLSTPVIVDMRSGMEIFLTRHGGLVCDPSALEAESREIIASSRLLGLHGKFQARHTHTQSEACLKHARTCGGMIFRNSESKRWITIAK